MLLIVFAIILRITSNSFLNVFQKEISGIYSALNTNFKTYFILSLFCLPLFFVFYPEISLEVISWAFIGGFFGAVGNAFLIAALKCGELSILGPVNSYKAIAGLIFGVVLIGEIPNISAIFGIFLILFGSYFIFDTTEGGFHFALFKRKDILYRFLALIFSAIEAVFIKKVIILTDITCSFLLWVIFGFIFSFVLLKLNHVKAFNKLSFRHEIFPFMPLSALVF